MDFTSGLKSEILRPIFIFIIPGLVIIVPSAFIADHYFPSVFSFTSSNPAPLYFSLAILTIFAGFLAYEIGTNIGARIIDKILKKKDPQWEDDWYMYLRCTFPTPPIGQKYIHDQVLYLKFEVNLAAALALCWPVTLVAWSLRNDLTVHIFLFVSILFVLVIFYFLHEGYNTAKGLAKVRKELLRGVGLPPSCMPAPNARLATNGDIATNQAAAGTTLSSKVTSPHSSDVSER